MAENIISNTVALVLAAGKGTRMKSELPKVLHKLLRKPMLWYLLKTLGKINFRNVFVVTGHGREQLENSFPDYRDNFLVQSRQLGTGHALQEAWPAISSTGAEWVLVANGDTPLAGPEHIEALVSGVLRQGADFGLLSIHMDDPSGYGRVIRNRHGQVTSIVESCDFDSTEQGTCSGEVNSGIYIFRISSLSRILFKLDANNQQKELYITQLIALAHDQKFKVTAICAGACSQLLGINNPAQLAEQEECLRRWHIADLMGRGVIVRAMDTVRISPSATIEAGADITGPCEIYGDSFVSSNAVIHSHCFIEDSRISDCEILSFCHIVQSNIRRGAVIGPFSRLRPGTVVEQSARTGNFVEIKNSTIGEFSKVSHLSYIGDTRMGSGVNIGAGTVTCNYDGRKKSSTVIDEHVFVGSNTSLVAPVHIGAESMIGAGSTITSDVPEESLSIARARQKNIPGRNPLKKR